jgi:hypothetical protein
MARAAIDRRPGMGLSNARPGQRKCCRPSISASAQWRPSQGSAHNADENAGELGSDGKEEEVAGSDLDAPSAWDVPGSSGHRCISRVAAPRVTAGSLATRLGADVRARREAGILGRRPPGMACAERIIIAFTLYTDVFAASSLPPQLTDVAQHVPIDPGSLLALNLGASAIVGGLCHAAERPIRCAALVLVDLVRSSCAAHLY